VLLVAVTMQAFIIRHLIFTPVCHTVRALSVQARMSQSPYVVRLGVNTKNRGRSSSRCATLSTFKVPVTVVI
jgi:hypothetical protein